MGSPEWSVRSATPDDAGAIAELLDDFNREFAVPTPGVGILAPRLQRLLAGEATMALVAGAPIVGVALMSLRTNVWYDRKVCLLDELYVRPHLRGRGIGSNLLERLVSDAAAQDIGLIEINVDEGDVDAQRFYRRHGFSDTEPDSTERAFYYFRELGDPPGPRPR